MIGYKNSPERLYDLVKDIIVNNIDSKLSDVLSQAGDGLSLIAPTAADFYYGEFNHITTYSDVVIVINKADIFESEPRQAFEFTTTLTVTVGIRETLIDDKEKLMRLIDRLWLAAINCVSDNREQLPCLWRDFAIVNGVNDGIANTNEMMYYIKGFDLEVNYG